MINTYISPSEQKELKQACTQSSMSFAKIVMRSWGGNTNGRRNQVRKIKNGRLYLRGIILRILHRRY